MLEPMRAALAELGVDLDRLREVEPDAALGNGGLGRLAACFMESMATLAVAAYGYGIRYNHGLFRQVIRDGWQREYPESWLSLGNPWEFERPEMSHIIRFGGSVRVYRRRGRHRARSGYPAETVEAIAYDTPIVGWRGRHVNTLRLWSARAPDRCGSTRSTRATLSAHWRPADAGRSYLAGALSERRHAGGTGAAPAAGVFLLVGVAAGPGVPPSPAASATCIRCPSTSPSSSTTRIRPSLSPN